jgi:hypothetical protein
VTPSRGARAALALALVRPAAALACPVCFSGSSDRVLGAYLVSAVVMTLLPLVLVGGFAVWLGRSGRDDDASPATHSSQA